MHTTTAHQIPLRAGHPYPRALHRLQLLNRLLHLNFHHPDLFHHKALILFCELGFPAVINLFFCNSRGS